MKNTFVIIVGVTILLSKTAYSQDSSRVVCIFKMMPTTLIDTDNSITIGLEVPLKNQWAFQQELGWGNASMNFSEHERKVYPDRNTWRYRTQIRHYIHTFAHPNKQLYLAAEYFRKDVFVSRDSTNTHKAVNGLHAKVGYQSVVDNFVFDAFFGLGFRYVNVTNDNPNAVFYGASTQFQPFKGVLPSLSLGFSIGYQIKKKRSIK
jgi:hypothetical protein